jgi:hypothetical protein
MGTPTEHPLKKKSSPLYGEVWTPTTPDDQSTGIPNVICEPPPREKINFKETTSFITPDCLWIEAEKARFIGINTIVSKVKRTALRAARGGDKSVNVEVKSSRWLDLAIEKLRGEKFTINVEKGRREVKIWIGW